MNKNKLFKCKNALKLTQSVKIALSVCNNAHLAGEKKASVQTICSYPVAISHHYFVHLG